MRVIVLEPLQPDEIEVVGDRFIMFVLWDLGQFECQTDVCLYRFPRESM